MVNNMQQLFLGPDLSKLNVALECIWLRIQVGP